MLMQDDGFQTSDTFIQTIHAWMEISTHRSMQAFTHWMSTCGLTKSELGALMRLYYQGECPISGIGEDLGISAAAASQLVDKLVHLDLLERVEHPHDRRIKQVYLRPAGEKLVRQGVDARNAWVDKLIALIAPVERGEIEPGLRTLLAAAQKMEKETV